MKKLMILAAVTCLLVGMSNAATTWSWTSYENHPAYGVDGSAYTGTAYLFRLDQNSNAAGQALVAKLREEYSKGTLDINAEGTVIGYQGEEAHYKLAAQAEVVNGMMAAHSFQAETSDGYVLRYAWCYESTGADGQTYLIADFSYAAGYESTSTIFTYNRQAQEYLDTRSSGNWTAGSMAVPEPTSGLLMLLGVAGLALRRKRA